MTKRVDKTSEDKMTRRGQNDKASIDKMTKRVWTERVDKADKGRENSGWNKVIKRGQINRTKRVDTAEDKMRTQ